MHRQAANDEGIASPFAQLFIMGAFVHELALGCQHVVGPRLLDMDERPRRTPLHHPQNRDPLGHGALVNGDLLVVVDGTRSLHAGFLLG